MEEVKVILTFVGVDGIAYDGTEFYTTHDRVMDMYKHPENYGWVRFSYTSTYKSRDKEKVFKCCVYN